MFYNDPRIGMVKCDLHKADDEDGSWITMNGTHVHLKDGEVDKGPQKVKDHVAGKNQEKAKDNAPKEVEIKSKDAMGHAKEAVHPDGSVEVSRFLGDETVKDTSNGKEIWRGEYLKDGRQSGEKIPERMQTKINEVRDAMDAHDKAVDSARAEANRAGLASYERSTEAQMRSMGIGEKSERYSPRSGTAFSRTPSWARSGKKW